jgi:hypothetical protein
MTYLKTYLPYLFGNKKGLSIKLPQDLAWGSLSFEETLMFHALKGSIQDFLQSQDPTKFSRIQLFHSFNFSQIFSKEYKAEFELFTMATNASPLSVKDIQEIINFKNDQLSLMAIIPTNRKHLGKLLLKKSNGEFFKDSCGNIWSIPILACSGRGLPFQHSNGQTPMGIYSIDGVMPLANKNYEFGKFRRLIVNFTESEVLLPSSQKNKSWWKQAVLAKELGRSLLRIHGTGRVNNNPFTPFFPFVPTSGCIATNEKSNDQRKLLDALMMAQELTACFENEEKIKSVLYVMEYNDSLQKLAFI